MPSLHRYTHATPVVYLSAHSFGETTAGGPCHASLSKSLHDPPKPSTYLRIFMVYLLEGPMPRLSSYTFPSKPTLLPLTFLLPMPDLACGS